MAEGGDGKSRSPQQRTYDIDQLGRLPEEQGMQLPIPLSYDAKLTDFAVPLRYEDLLDAEFFDCQAAIALVEEVGRWTLD